MLYPQMLGKLTKMMLDMTLNFVFVYIIEWPVKLCISPVLENL